VSAVHWKIALQTGVGTGILALLLRTFKANDHLNYQPYVRVTALRR
jgi:hypothetical protein